MKYKLNIFLAIFSMFAFNSCKAQVQIQQKEKSKNYTFFIDVTKNEENYSLNSIVIKSSKTGEIVQKIELDYMYYELRKDSLSNFIEVNDINNDGIPNFYFIYISEKGNETYSFYELQDNQFIRNIKYEEMFGTNFIFNKETREIRTTSKSGPTEQRSRIFERGYENNFSLKKTEEIKVETIDGKEYKTYTYYWHTDNEGKSEINTIVEHAIENREDGLFFKDSYYGQKQKGIKPELFRSIKYPAIENDKIANDLNGNRIYNNDVLDLIKLTPDKILEKFEGAARLIYTEEIGEHGVPEGYIIDININDGYTHIYYDLNLKINRILLANQWQCPMNLKNGMTISDLEKINGGPFDIYFGVSETDQSDINIVKFKNQELGNNFVLGITLYTAGNRKNFDDKKFKSNNPALKILNLKLATIDIFAKIEN